MAKSVPPAATCFTCTFFDPVTVTDVYITTEMTVQSSHFLHGVCRRYPPVPSERINKAHEDLVDIIGRWPLVPGDLWCGEYTEEVG